MNKDKSLNKQKQRQQIEEDNAALNWRASTHLLNLARDKRERPTSPLTSPIQSPRTITLSTKYSVPHGGVTSRDSLPRQDHHHEKVQGASVLVSKYKKEKDWKYLQEFWRKLTNKRDTKAKYNLNSQSSIWYIIWASNWVIRTMAKSFEALESHFEAHKDERLLTNEQSALSHFYALAWDSMRLGILSFDDFAFGFIVACTGTPDIASHLLFCAMDADGDGRIVWRDIQHYAKMLFFGNNDISTKVVISTIDRFFANIDKNPFDIIEIEEFKTFVQLYPEGVLGSWSQMLNFFTRFNKCTDTTPHEVQTNATTQDKRKDKEIPEEAAERTADGKSATPRTFEYEPSRPKASSAGGRLASSLSRMAETDGDSYIKQPRIPSFMPSSPRSLKRAHSPKGILMASQDGDSPKKRTLKRRDGTGWGKAVVALDERMAVIGESGSSGRSEASPPTHKRADGREREHDRVKSKRSLSIGGDIGDESEEAALVGKKPTRRPLSKAKTADHKRVK